MNNEQYLIVSYFTLGVVAAGVGVAVWLWLRGAFCGVLAALGPRPATAILRRLFFPGLLLPALAGFCAVSFRSCDKDTYAKIIADREYLVAKNHELLSSTLAWAAIALTVWGFIVLGLWLAGLRTPPGQPSP